MKVKLRSILVLRISGILVLTILSIGTFLYFRANQEVSELSDRIIKSTSGLIDERLDALLTGVENECVLFAGLIQPTVGKPLTSKSSVISENRASQMIELLKSNEDISSVSFISASTGEYVKTVRAADGSMAIEISEKEANGSITRRDLAPFGSDLLERGRTANWEYDPRKEPFFAQCKEKREIVWSEPYVIRTTSGLDAPGLTCAAPVLTANGKFIGVAAVDITLLDLSRFLKSIQVGQNGYAILAERFGPGKARLIAHPDQSRLLVADEGHMRLATLAELNEPLLTLLVDRLGEVNLSAGGSVRETLKVSGASWLCGIRRIRHERLPNWTAFIVVPEREFTGRLNEAGIVLLVVLAVALALSVTGSIIFANRITRPLHQLVEQTSRIRELALDAGPTPSSNIAEIDDLANSMESMKSALRSFQKLVPADYARFLMRSGQEAKLGGERRHLTTSFADIIGFTSFSETVPPETLTQILSEYLDVLSGEVLKSEGTVDKFNGDDVMAFWGAPAHVEDHALAACTTALSSQITISRLYADWATREIPRLRIAFGIATGDVVVGNVGSRERMNYTVIGDSVNLASRLQGLNREYQTEILISEQTAKEAGKAIIARLVDHVIVQGKESSVPVYELIGLADDTDHYWDKLIEVYGRGLDAYMVKDWDAAEKFFREVKSLRPQDGPARTMLARIERWKLSPPGDDWTGAYQIGYK